MISRGAFVLLVAGAVVIGGAPAASAAEPEVGSRLYVVRADLRLCPSPLCGGHWVALANHSRTRCHDGARRPRCYVARVVDEHRRQLTKDVPDGSLARADLERLPFEGFGELGVLAAAEVFVPAGHAPETGRFFRLVDTGIRCVRSPCFSTRAARLNSAVRTPVSGIDLGAARATSAEVARAEAALRTKNGLLARGRFVRGSDGGRVFRASRLFLGALKPRA